MHSKVNLALCHQPNCEETILHCFVPCIGHFLQSNVHTGHFVSLCKEAEGGRQEYKSQFLYITVQ